jgi:hypothetical protein
MVLDIREAVWTPQSAEAGLHALEALPERENSFEDGGRP